MVSLRDIEALQKFSTLLAILLFTAALMAHLEMLDEHYMPDAERMVEALDDFALIDWTLNSSPRYIQVMGG